MGKPWTAVNNFKGGIDARKEKGSEEEETLTGREDDTSHGPKSFVAPRESQLTRGYFMQGQAARIQETAANTAYTSTQRCYPQKS